MLTSAKGSDQSKTTNNDAETKSNNSNEGDCMYNLIPGKV